MSDMGDMGEKWACVRAYHKSAMERLGYPPVYTTSLPELSVPLRILWLDSVIRMFPYNSKYVSGKKMRSGTMSRIDDGTREIRLRAAVEDCIRIIRNWDRFAWIRACIQAASKRHVDTRRPAAARGSLHKSSDDPVDNAITLLKRNRVWGVKIPGLLFLVDYGSFPELGEAGLRML